MNACRPPAQADKSTDLYPGDNRGRKYAGATPAQTRKEFYPGTDRQIVGPPRTPGEAPDPNRWDAHPREFTVRGKVTEFFPIGALAKALGREPVTIRRWEDEGIIPVSLWRAPSESVYGRARLYSRELIEGIVAIAHEEGVLTRGRPIKGTRFKERVYELFVRVSKAERAAATGRAA